MCSPWKKAIPKPVNPELPKPVLNLIGLFLPTAAGIAGLLVRTGGDGRKKVAKTEGILSVSAASVMFLMTENMALPARFADGWSVAMVLFAVANVLLLLSVTDLKGVKSTE